MADAPSVQLIDDRDLFRNALRGLLENEGVRVTTDTGDIETAGDEYERNPADVVVVDASLRTGDGIALIRSLTLRHPRIRIIVLTQSTDVLLAIESFRAGAHGLMLKDDDVTMLVEAIREVRAGNGYLSPRMASDVIGVLCTDTMPDGRESSSLSARESEVLSLLTLGMNNDQIGVELEISSKTAKNHVSNILGKLGLENRVQAAVFAVRHGIA